MTAKYFAILTNQGAARLANAAALGTKLNLTQMAVGDANGTLPTPDPAQTKLINQKRIAPLNLLTVDPANTSQIIAEQIIPENEGGFWIREIGLYDDAGVLIAVANCPETYKPQLQEGSGRTQTIRMILIVSSTSAITLKIDPSVVLATRKYVDSLVVGMLAKSENGADIPDKQRFLQNIGVFNIVNPTSPNQTVMYTPDMKKCLVIREDGTWGACVVNNGQVIALPVNAGGTGATNAGDARKNLGLDVLLEGKQPLNDVLTAIAGLVTQQNTMPYFTGEEQAAVTALSEFMRVMLGKADAASVAAYLGVGSGAPVIGSPFAWPLAQMPSDVFDDMKNMVFLKANGAPFDKNRYSKLSVTYPSGMLPDMRGEFMRGYDDGRGVDSGRSLLSPQGATAFTEYHGDGGLGQPPRNYYDNPDFIKYAGTGFTAYGSTATVRDGITNFIGVRPRNIAFNFIVRAA
ncbi:phage tail protein [Escherichia coli O68:H12]|uniref:phage tail-collar fiber domain-containing protein n=1 Tax=Escherichia coli TaxID=562 RepID=UPI00168CC20C|nr:phage tail protein [Escherichia coli]QOD26795.1 phage tail protein [Escherichia coli O68:H12]